VLVLFSIQTTNYYAFYISGMTYQTLGHFDEADNHFAKALEVYNDVCHPTTLIRGSFTHCLLETIL